MQEIGLFPIGYYFAELYIYIFKDPLFLPAYHIHWLSTHWSPNNPIRWFVLGFCILITHCTRYALYHFFEFNSRGCFLRSGSIPRGSDNTIKSQTNQHKNSEQWHSLSEDERIKLGVLFLFFNPQLIVFKNCKSSVLKQHVRSRL